MKKTSKHNIYEVWNEYTAESVFVNHCPTIDELKQIVKEEHWETSFINVYDYIHVDKLKRFYTR